MSNRPRIRSIKPEAWQDENVGALSHGARLLMVGLITMADDEGRLRALPSVILGHVFPWDEIPPRKLETWLAEIERAGVIVRYRDEGKPYAAFRHWRRHQKINKPTPSVLPPPPDPVVLRENSLPDSRSATGELPERSGNGSCPPARADRIGSDRNGTEPPLPPQGGRARDRAAYKEQLTSFRDEHFPDAPTDLVAHCADELRVRGVDPTVDALRPHIEQWRPKEAAA